MRLLGIFSIISTAFQGIKEACEPTIPAANWANKELMDKDRSRGMSEQQIMQNVKNGRYVMTVQYPVPHRETTGNHRVIIENCELHKEDVRQYGAYEAYKWVDQGKYNLNAEEHKITDLQYEEQKLRMWKLIGTIKPEEEKRLEEVRKILANTKWDCRNTEAVRQWQKAHDANIGRY